MKKGRVKVIAFVFAVLFIYLMNKVFGWTDFISDGKLFERMAAYTEENFLIVWFAYTVLTITGCVVLALPGVTFAVAAGIIFSPVAGIISCLIATTLGAMLSFLVGRFFLKESVKPMLEKNKTLKKLLFSDDENNYTVLLMVTRTVPVFPYNLQNFAYGITDISFWRYSALTFAFMTPGVSFFTIGAAGIADADNRAAYLTAAALLAVAVTSVGIYLKKKYIK